MVIEHARFTKDVWLVFAFSVTYLFGAIPLCLAAGNHEFQLYIIVTTILVAIVGSVHFRVGLTTPLLWGMSFWGLLHMAGGLLHIPDSWPREGVETVLYNLWLVPRHLKFDQFVHAYGFGMTTWLCWQGFRKIVASKLKVSASQIKPTLGMLAICVAAGMGFGAMNEIVEFAATLTVPNTNVGGYENTGWDLVFNFYGCLISALLIKKFD